MSTPRKPTPPIYDVALVRGAAATRWPEILANVGGIPADFLDGNHHPCPKCGGTDRFRLFDEAAGAVICNQCFRTRNGDGFAALQWMLGLDFPWSLAKAGEYLGVPPTTNGKARKGKGKKEHAEDPAVALEPEPWTEGSRRLLATWCNVHKPGTSPEAVIAAGGFLARYPCYINKQTGERIIGAHRVICLPIYGPPDWTAAPYIGVQAYRLDGQPLEVYKGANAPPQLVKVKTIGSATGLIGVGQLDGVDPASILRMWKVEGCSDLLALLSVILADAAGGPVLDVVLTNAGGSNQNTGDLIEPFAGHTVNILHDADQPGEAGAVKWSKAIAAVAATTRHVRLPYNVDETHGADLRDWINEGHTYQDLVALADAAPVIEPPAADAHEQPDRYPDQDTRTDNADDRAPVEADDDPHRLARLVVEACEHLRFWQGEHWLYNSAAGCYARSPLAEFRAIAGRAIKAEFDNISRRKLNSYADGDPTATKVTSNLTRNVVDAVGSLSLVPGTMPMGSWLGHNPGPRPWIALRNGILKLDVLMDDPAAELEDVLVAHSPHWFSRIVLPYDFDPAATCQRWLATLTHNLEHDDERLAIMQEWAGYCLTADTSQQKCLILEGEGANGKSVYLAGLQAMLGLENVSNVPLESFGDRFALTQTLGKLVNVAADCSEIEKAAEGPIKAFTSGDRMYFDRKGVAGVECLPTARLVLATNSLPHLSDKSGGIWRRIILVPFRIQIDEAEAIRGMDKPEWWHASGELPGILLWAIRGLERLRRQGRFTASSLCRTKLADYRLDVNPARAFIQEHYTWEDTDRWTGATAIYKAYTNWCRECGYKPLADGNFGKEIRRAFPRTVRHQRRDEFSKRFYVYQGVTEIADAF